MPLNGVRVVSRLSDPESLRVLLGFVNESGEDRFLARDRIEQPLISADLFEFDTPAKYVGPKARRAPYTPEDVVRLVPCGSVFSSITLTDLYEFKGTPSRFRYSSAHPALGGGTLVLITSGWHNLEPGVEIAQEAV